MPNLKSPPLALPRNKPRPILAHGLMVAYYAIDTRYVYGPFVTAADAQDWAESHSLTEPVRYFSLGPLQQLGNTERADSVGVVL